VARRKFSAAFQTTIEGRVVRPVVTNQLKVSPTGLAPVGARQNR
jgi:hypothetical protein